MISPKAQLNLKNAREYFRHHLAANDYYSQKNSVAGEWIGSGAERLNLSGKVTEEAFLSLCEGNHPETGKRLTQRRNSIRRKNGALIANRRVYYDYTISPPKSVSVAALMLDARIVGAHERAVRVVLKELEAFAETRVRIGQKDGGRPTGNLVAACFRHDTSRELDPHLHTHCIVFNATLDPVECRWKALQTHGMLKAGRFASSLYDHEMSRELRALGYALRPNGRSFEIEGISPALIARFSKRRRQIDEETAKRIAAEGPGVNLPEMRSRVAHERRRRKIKEATAERLRSSWFGQLDAGEQAALDALRQVSPPGEREKADLPALLAWGERHVFDRKSVVPSHELMAAALLRGRGQNFSLTVLRQTLERMPMIFAVDQGQIISRELVELEAGLVAIARKTSRTEGGFIFGFTPDAGLKDEQRRAVTKILESYSFITLFRGAAGTGKSHTLREVKRGLEAAGRPVVVLAPQRQQVLDLEADGLSAQTLAKFIDAGKVPPRAAILLDEASQVGIRDMHQLVELARSAGARLILSGDTRQHGAVAASDALILLERFAGLPVAKLRTIRRQDPSLATTTEEKRAIAAYRSAVRLASKGRAAEAFDALDALGWVKEQALTAGREELARDYVEAVGRNERSLIVAQTWNEVDAVNATVQSSLRSAGRIGPGDTLTTYRAADLTRAQKEDPSSYEDLPKVFFLKRYGRYARGDVCSVVGVSKRGLTLVKNGRKATMGYRYAEHLSVLRERAVVVSAGDRLQIKFNGKSADGQSLVNGELVTVRTVHSDGRISVESDRGQKKILGSEQRLFNLGYAVTSYSSQGKTVDTVIFADAGSRTATNQKQWFVTISRARRRALVFTSNKAALRAAIVSDGHRMLAMEATRGGRPLANIGSLAETVAMPIESPVSMKVRL